MPPPADENLLARANDLLHEFDALFGVSPGFRPMHARGALLRGTSVPVSKLPGSPIEAFLGSHPISGRRRRAAAANGS